MDTDLYIRQVDDGSEIVAYRTRPLQHTLGGTTVIGMPAAVTHAAANDRDIIDPVQVIRRPGLGDKMFASLPPMLTCGNTQMLT